MRYARIARAWLAFHLWLRLPGRVRFSGLGLWLLPWVGDWAYADDMRAIGMDPWARRTPLDRALMTMTARALLDDLFPEAGNG